MLVQKAIFPVAGLGTRFLPATKAQPKEMLPVVDKPVIQYVVEEAVAAGIDDILIITGRGKRAIEDHFDRSLELEAILERKNDREALDEVRAIANMAHIHFIRQKQAKGLGDAILVAERYVGDQPFAVLLGDVITLTETPCIGELIRLSQSTGHSVIAVERVAQEDISKYGIIKPSGSEGSLLSVKDLVEKPRPQEAPSNLAIFGRYVLSPHIFSCLKRTKPGKNGEIQLTDALRLLLEEEPIWAHIVEGRRFDLGDKFSWLKATIELALLRPDFADHIEDL